LDESDIFNTTIDDYYNNTISLFHKVDQKDLEQIKIILSWLIRNRNNVSVYYLKEFSSKELLYKTISYHKHSRIKRVVHKVIS